MKLNRKFKKHSNLIKGKIMKTLNFDVTNLEYYKTIYDSLCFTQKQFNKQQNRRLDYIFTQFENIGVKDVEVNGVQLYKLESPASISLEDADFEIVKQAIEETQYTGIGARKAGKVLTWLEEERKEVKEDKPQPLSLS